MKGQQVAYILFGSKNKYFLLRDIGINIFLALYAAVVFQFLLLLQINLILYLNLKYKLTIVNLTFQEKIILKVYFGMFR